MIADCFVLWKIDDPYKYTQTLSAQKSNAEFRIDTIVYNSLKNVISSLSQEEVISGRDGELAQAIEDNIGDTLAQYGITLLAVETKSLDLPDENKNAVYAGTDGRPVVRHKIPESSLSQPHLFLWESKMISWGL